MSPSASTNQRLIAACALAGLFLAACAGHPVLAPDEAPQRQASSAGRETSMPGSATQGKSAGERAAIVAVRQVGVPYRYGGSSETGFDCSGLVQYAYANAGRKLPRTTSDLWRQTRPVSGNQLEVGDLLFFDIEGKVAHVGIYVGSGRFVHAPSSGREVTVADLDSAFYRDAFIRGGRPR
jgi:cell wall-associated NlpC family hydrolase